MRRAIRVPRLERRGLQGRAGFFVALAAGAAAGVAHPPFGVWPGIFGFALLLHVLDAAADERRLRSAFARGWAAGFAYLLVGTWWVGEAFLVDVQAHGWMAPFAVLGLPAGLGLFWGGAGVAYRLIAPSAARRVLVFAAVLAVFEWLRGHLLTGFPWDLPGEAWTAGTAPSQGAALIGAYGMTVVTVAIGAAPAVLLGTDGRRARIVTVALAALALAGLWGFGAWRLSRPAPADTALLVRVVQPDIPQSLKWDEAAVRGIVRRYAELTATPAARRPDVVIWPESALPISLEEAFAPGYWPEAAIRGALAPGQTLLAGVFRFDGERYFNSLAALRRTDAGFQPLALYDKYRLVPFGEYLPLDDLMRRLGLKKLAGVGEAFTPGPEPEPIQPAGLPRLQPLICYESLFPGFVATHTARPQWIVNVSNDAWFGRTSGPWQHLNLASYRAIEEGLPVVRSTPTGVSAVVDGYGRARAQLAQGERGVLDARLPAALEPTPYSRLRDAPFWIMCLGGLACAWRLRRRRVFAT